MPTHFAGNRQDRAVLDSYIKLMRASGALHANLNTVAREHGLTPSQFGVLECLLHLGPLNQRAVGEKLFFTEGNVTQVARNLERAGHIVRRRDPDDRRSLVLSLSRGGRAAIRRAFADYLTRLRRDFGALKSGEVLQLGELCRRLGRHAES